MQLLEKGGEVYNYLKNPHLNFKGESNLYEDCTYIYYLPNKQGFNLSAYRDEIVTDLIPEERILTKIMNTNRIIVFDDFPTQVAHIGLFDETAEVTNVHYLIRALYDLYITRMKRESKLTEIVRDFGISGTYQAAWVDEETKLEFVAKILMPGDEKSSPNYVTYRRLKTISDPTGNLIPFGKKANISQQKVIEILSAQKKQITGSLSWAQAKI